MTKKVRSIVWQGVAILGILVLAFYFAYIAQGNESVRMAVAEYGYAGIFLVSLISGFNFVVPIPAITFLPLFMEAGLNFLLTVIVITIGTTLADSAAYFIGGFGHKMLAQSEHHLEKDSMYQRLLRLKKRHAYAPFVLFFVYVIFAPLPNELMLVPMGLLGYRFRNILPIVCVGNFIFNLMYANGVESLFNFFV